MKVVTWSLQMLERPLAPARPFPEGARLERATGIGPEYARFLYGLVGGPWRWTDRLHWSREQWAEELAVPGTEFHVLYAEGVPRGYVQLYPQPGGDGGTDVEIRYFGLAEEALGRGFGGRLLEHGIQAAWTLPERFDLPAVARVWVHTCSLDGPAALANYRARGLVVYKTEETEEQVPEEPLGAWCSTGGPVPR
ncbi:GNAT family N-acetyltransferase [Sediminivirga luteola]|uniref:N-acetyltransferase n=1 Tax=Sediminivirga luteola TaxID=1774748 RepID=A0A8J2TWB4_9MICO|nr:GNAT family N-acetyltransferase [Sediminivirga luteola]MCI2265697.1 GNAT family N-acetyltransferase [Sediminivirga luteola]GGA07342.1 N-acetyltransferase [Sediminivirga luteola]